MVRGTGNALARMLVGSADIDQHGALVKQSLGLGGRDRGQAHDLSPSLTRLDLRCGDPVSGGQ